MLRDFSGGQYGCKGAWKLRVKSSFCEEYAARSIEPPDFGLIAPSEAFRFGSSWPRTTKLAQRRRRTSVNGQNSGI